MKNKDKHEKEENNHNSLLY